MVEKKLIRSYLEAKLAETPILAKERTQELFGKRRVYSRIEKYVNDFLSGEVENRVVILPGLRGVGKTTILLQIYNYLTQVKKVEQARVLYFSADELKDYLGAKISEAIKVFVEDIWNTSLTSLDKPLFILIDEAHYDKGWALSAKIVYDQTKRIFLLLTGSSALSMEMSVDLARRAKKETVFPLNFSEYLILKYKKYPPRGTAESIRNLLFEPSEDHVKEASRRWNELRRGMLNIGKPLEKEFEYFLLYGGFPFMFNLDEKGTHERIFSMIDRIVEKDVLTIKSFNTKTRNLITRIIYHLALQKPGGTSDVKLSKNLSASSRLIRGILDILEKTHLIFSIKPYGSAGKVSRKPWKYYFLSPSINAAIRFKLGHHDPKDRDMLGLFAENLVASSFFRMKETMNQPTGIFYDPGMQGVDFIIEKGIGEKIPVEVTIGRGNGKTKKAIEKYSSKHGVCISSIDDILLDDNVVHIPLIFFSFI
ncbi:MAG: ATP-binding protein [Thermoproteota archaeon]|nr:ATP-binding protein [Candidatus Brockarchaeota archaeon]